MNPSPGVKNGERERTEIAARNRVSQAVVKSRLAAAWVYEVAALFFSRPLGGGGAQSSLSCAQERASVSWDRKRALSSLVGRIFWGKTVSTFSEKAFVGKDLNDGLRCYPFE